MDQDLDSMNAIKYENFKNSQRYHPETKDYLYTRFTRITPVTCGPVYEVCYFKIGNLFNMILNSIKDLFECPYRIMNNDFEDLTFYKEKDEVLVICSHEHFAYMVLNDEEYDKFLKLNIPHDLHD
jgi:hypothetical protein